MAVFSAVNNFSVFWTFPLNFNIFLYYVFFGIFGNFRSIFHGIPGFLRTPFWLIICHLIFSKFEELLVPFLCSCIKLCMFTCLEM